MSFEMSVAHLDGVQQKRSSNASQASPQDIEADQKAPKGLLSEDQWQLLTGISKKMVEHPIVSGIMGVLTIWTLYQSDILAAGTDKGAVDIAFEAIMTIAFFAFASEMILVCIYDPEYLSLPTPWTQKPDETWSQCWWRRSQFGSFYFWLDFLATATIVLDLQWLLSNGGYDAVSGASSQTDDSQAANASQRGVQAARVLRIVRMVRMIRIAKLYKYAYAAIFDDAKIRQQLERSESRVGAAMSDLTNRRVIVLILLMLIVIPLLTVSESDTSLQLGAQLLHEMSILTIKDEVTFAGGLQFALQTVKEELPLIAVALNDVYVYYDHPAMTRLRASEISAFTLSTPFDGIEAYTYVVYDQKIQSVTAALYSIYTTTFIILLLLLGIYFFANDVNELVIYPIERLVELVKKISANPLTVDYQVTYDARDGFVDGMETTFLLVTINKIGALLRVGFGEAGASIIAKNLSESSTTGKLNLLGAGTMIHSIFGFCDVRQFTDTTECLQEEVMLFVNRIAHILHSIVVQCAGAANKNIGDAFLLTWKIDDTSSTDMIAFLADQALLTFCRAIIELNRYQEFLCNFSIAATSRLYKRFPQYQTRIGCGLHVGWAIEGAIGSHRKIDASYLSPHVSTTEYLESNTKQYGVSLLFSEPFYRLLSPQAKQYTRQVDRIRRNVKEEPMGLYTYDTDLHINWNDPFRSTFQQRLDNTKSRLQYAAEHATNMPGRKGSATSANIVALGTIQEHSGRFSTTSGGTNPGPLQSVGSTSSNNPRHGIVPKKRQPRSSLVVINSNPGNGVGVNALITAHQQMGKTGRRRSGFISLPINFESLAETEQEHQTSDDEDDVEAARKREEEEIKRKAKALQTPTITLAPYTPQIWLEDSDLIELRNRVDDAFRALWGLGIEAYIKGNWETAKDIFQQTLKLSNKKDGPSKYLLSFMEETAFQPLADWEGYRSEGDGGH